MAAAGKMLKAIVSHADQSGLRKNCTGLVNADWERTGVSGMTLDKCFVSDLGMMVARDGVEPPPPAFSGRR
jgi:hypothetical protein